jgi:hypothetical protein
MQEYLNLLQVTRRFPSHNGARPLRLFATRDAQENSSENKLFRPLPFAQYREKLLAGEIHHLSPVSLAIQAIESSGSDPINPRVARLYGLKEAAEYRMLTGREDHRALYGWGPTATNVMRALKGMERDGGIQNFLMLVTEPGDGKTTFMDNLEEAMINYSQTHPLYRIKGCPNGDSASVLLSAEDRAKLRQKGVFVDGQPCPHCQQLIVNANNNRDNIPVQPFAIGNGVGSSGISPMWSMVENAPQMEYVFNTLIAANGGFIRMDELANQAEVLIQLKDYLRGKKLDHREGGRVFANTLFLCALTQEEFDRVFPKYRAMDRYSFSGRRSTDDGRETVIPLLQRSKLVFGRHNLQYGPEMQALNKVDRLANVTGTHFSSITKGILAQAIIMGRMETSELYPDAKEGQAYRDRYDERKMQKLTPAQKFLLFMGSTPEHVSEKLLQAYMKEFPTKHDGQLGLSGALVDGMVKELLGQSEVTGCVDAFSALDYLGTYLQGQENYLPQPSDYHLMDAVSRSRLVLEQWVRETVIAAFVEEFEPQRREQFKLYYNEIGRLLLYEELYGAEERKKLEAGQAKQMPLNTDDDYEIPIDIAFLHKVEDAATGKELDEEARVVFRRDFSAELKRLEMAQREQSTEGQNGKVQVTEKYGLVEHPERFYDTLSGQVGQVAKAVTNIVIATSETKSERDVATGKELIESPEDTIRSVLTPGIQTPQQRLRIENAKTHLKEGGLCPHCINVYLTYAAKHMTRLTLDAATIEKLGITPPHAFLRQEKPKKPESPVAGGQ